MKTDRMPDALKHAISTPNQRLDGLNAHFDAGSQYVRIRYTDRVAEIGATLAIGLVGDTIDNAVA